jgi:hypothetical protein
MPPWLSTDVLSSPIDSHPAPSGAECLVTDKLPTIELTSRELHLLLEYGYPFEEQAQTLRASKAVRGYHRVRLDSFWIEMLLGDVIRSAREITNRRLLDELDGVCGALECALNEANRVGLR